MAMAVLVSSSGMTSRHSLPFEEGEASIASSSDLIHEGHHLLLPAVVVQVTSDGMERLPTYVGKVELWDTSQHPSLT